MCQYGWDPTDLGKTSKIVSNSVRKINVVSSRSHFDHSHRRHSGKPNVHCSPTRIQIAPSRPVMNFGSVNAQFVRNRGITLIDYTVDNDLDLLAITETWLSSDVNNDRVDVGLLKPTGMM